MEEIIQKINKASLKLLEPLTPEETYERIVKEAVKLVNGKEGRIILKHGNILEVVYTSKGDADKLQVRKGGNTWQSFSKRKAFVIHEKTIAKINPKDIKNKYKSIIFIPLHYKKKSFGVLLIKSKELQKFSDKELEILKLFGAISSLTLRKTELLSETRKNLEIKDKFIALAAHELRTPLTTMNGYIQILHKKLNKSESAELKWTESLLHESKRLTTLIEEILDINKMNAGKMNYTFEECNLNDIIRDSVKLLKQTYPSHVVSIEMKNKDQHIISDESKLKKAVYNVLENSAKFSPVDTPIHLSLKYSKTYSIIEIHDYGEGIEYEDLPFVFEGFFKGRNNEQEGMGLGLFYTQNIISGHHGKIDIKSSKNRGTSVKLKLPLIQYG
ncbi:MAG: GAF domain-containing sensor histidine kinase [Patescibacteria group bacterium]